MTASTATTPGILYVIATPIGNLDDISARAIKTLQSVDKILAEDTRHSQPMLSALGIKKPLIALHAHNETYKSEQLIASLQSGLSFALISDAGTPLISDPGFPLVKLARQHHITVTPIPGACAMICALSAAGIASDIFTFAGFLPAKQAARCEKLKELSLYQHTIILYESTHRIVNCVEDIASVFGPETQLVLAKELTKTFERFISGTCNTVKDWLLSDKGHVKGEFVVLIPPRSMAKETKQEEQLLKVLLDEMPLKQAVKIAGKLTGTNKNELYRLALNITK